MGYQAVLPQEGDKTKTTNVPLELLLRYVVGRSGRLLPWEQFTEERPEVSPQDYANARRQQFDKGIGNIGLFKATSRNLEGEPEYTMMGFRVPLSSAATAGGAMIGGIGGARLLDAVVEQHLRSRYGQDLDAQLPERGDLSLMRRGNRRLLGGAVGALGGALAGNVTAKQVNDRVIQPRLNPEMVAAEKAWLAGAAQRTLEERVRAMAPEPRNQAEQVPDLQIRLQNQQQIQQQLPA
jgi:hypothetical protein